MGSVLKDLHREKSFMVRRPMNDWFSRERFDIEEEEHGLCKLEEAEEISEED